MVNKKGDAYEHRVVLYDSIGPGSHPCHWCQRLVLWEVELQADHVDGDRSNNSLSNLVPSCPGCNTRRNGRWANKSNKCGKGHEYTPENTYVIPATGCRQCRKCGNERKAAHKRKVRARARRAPREVKESQLLKPCRACGGSKIDAGAAGWYCVPCANDPLRGARKPPNTCGNGHQLTDANLTYVRATSGSNRMRWRCVLCTREKSYAAFVKRRDAAAELLLDASADA